ncbi:MAG: response regulator transcription factor [Saprospiraceae bacterium]|nr:response regulator transcription factor [Saprospiraceae bacterium]
MSRNVVIADAQFIVRHGLYDLLRKNGYEITEMCENKNETFSAISQSVIDVLILDYNKVEEFSLEEVAEVKSLSPDTNIIAITDYSNKTEVLRAIEVGVLSFLTKDCDKREILDAIEATSKGEKFFCNRVLDFILEGQIEKLPTNCKPSILSSREMDVVKCMSRGLKAKDIADELDLSIHTIYTHQKNIMKKLNLKSSAEVILYALNEGISTT